MDEVIRVSTNHNLFEEKGEPKRYRTEVLPLTSLSNALPLGQTGALSYATEGALFISAQLSTDAVSALPKVRVLIRLWKQPSAQART